MSISSSRRERRGLPRGPHGLTPQEVAESQHSRLLAAITEAVAERGYTATPVSEVIERAGVSRKTFYVHFKDRRDCLLAAYGLASERTLEQASKAFEQAPERNRLTDTVLALCSAALQSPGGSRLQVAEIAGAGEEGLLLRERKIRLLGALLRNCLSPAASAPSPPVMGLIAGGLLRVIDQRTIDGELVDVAAIARELTRWIRGYHPSPAALAKLEGSVTFVPGSQPSLRASAGGRAPGTLSLTSTRLPEAGRGVSPSFTAHNQRERILDAVTNLSAGKGYVALTVDEIVAVAAVSLNTFYEHFRDKEDAFLVAHELGHMRGAAILEHALSLSSNWEQGVREGIDALVGFFFSEPAFARLASVEAPIATSQTAARVRHHLAGYARLLMSGAPRSRKPPAIAEQAIAAALHEALFAFSVDDSVHEPATAHGWAIYIVLAPFLGPSRAIAS